MLPPEQLPKVLTIVACIAAYTGLEALRLSLPAPWQSPLRIAEGCCIVGLIIAAVLMSPKRKG